MGGGGSVEYRWILYQVYGGRAVTRNDLRTGLVSGDCVSYSRVIDALQCFIYVPILT
jgi:hypothetical protein